MDMLTTIACNQVPLPITPDADERPVVSSANSTPVQQSLSRSLAASHADLMSAAPSPRLNGGGVGSVSSGLGPPLPPSALNLQLAGLGGGGGGGQDLDPAAAVAVRLLQRQQRLSQQSRSGSLAEVVGNSDECALVQRAGSSTSNCPPTCSGCPTHPNSTFCKGKL